MVTHETYRAGDGSWLSPDEVKREGDDWIHVESGAPVASGRVEKMSKSKKNTVDPEPILDRYGADAVRWFMLSDSPPERDLEWSIGGIEGAARFVQRVWRLATAPSGNAGEDDALNRKLHRAIHGVGEAIDGLQFNKSVAALYELTNSIEKAKPSATRDEAIRTLLLLVAPGAPHLAEEAWAGTCQKPSEATENSMPRTRYVEGVAGDQTVVDGDDVVGAVLAHPVPAVRQRHEALPGPPAQAVQLVGRDAGHRLDGDVPVEAGQPRQLLSDDIGLQTPLPLERHVLEVAATAGVRAGEDARCDDPVRRGLVDRRRRRPARTCRRRCPR